jgi:hypothetical protein
VGSGAIRDRASLRLLQAIVVTDQRPGRLTSLLLVEERLLEAEYFATRLADASDGTVLGYELNAFLSAARSVTFLLQKEMSHVHGFAQWWRDQQDRLRQDAAARFFLEQRNFSQKKGRVSIVGACGSGASKRWRYFFAGTTEPVPAGLLNREIADCCLEHLAKLANLILLFADAFPCHACPSRALTPEGVAALALNLDKLEESLGLPPAFLAARPRATVEERIRFLSRNVDPVDFEVIRRVARYVAKPPMSGDGLGGRLALSMVEQIDRARSAGVSHDQAAKIALISEALRADRC